MTYDEAQRAAERRYRALVEHSAVAILMTAPDGSVISANPAACELFGRSEAEICSVGRAGLVAPGDTRLATLLEERAQTGRFVGRLTLVRGDGSTFEAEVNSVVFDSAGGVRSSMVVQDVSARVAGEARLRENEQRYRALFENMNAGFVLFEVVQDEGGAPIDLLVLAANEGFEATTGLKAREVIGKHLTHVLPGIENDAADWIGTYGAIALSGVPRQFVQGSELLGYYYSVTAYQAAPGQCAVTFLDVSEQRKAENALRASEQRYRRLAENLPDVLWRIDAAGETLFVNRAVTSLLGHAPAEVVGRPIAAFLAPPSRERLEIWIAAVRAAAGERASFFSEVEYLDKDGHLVPGELHAVAAFDEHGALAAIEGVARDIRERRRLERERSEMESQLHQSQRLEAVGRLAGGIAHDFNNLLSVIIAYADLAARALPVTEPVRADVLEIREAGERAAALTRQLLAFSRKQVLEPEVLDLNEVVASVETMLRRLLSEDIEIETRRADSLGRVLVDRGQIELVLLNLAVNARDAMPDGGTLTIETGNVHVGESREHEPAGVEPGPYVVLSVTDTGVGIDEETRSRIFEPFFSTKEKGKGTGLGLASAYGIVKQSGGDIAVCSVPGRGTTFEVYLPSTVAPVAATSRQTGPTALTGSETVLVVEDEEGVRNIAERILQQAGYTVLTAATPQAALLLCAERCDAIDLLLADVVMPTMSGRELAESIIAQRPGIKVLYMSGYTSDAIARRGVLEPGTYLLTKPFTAAELTSRVRAVLDEPEA